jgi:hypothetical protein
MTDAQWRQCEVPKLMLDAIASKATERKLRLFAAACWRRVPRISTDTGCARAVEVAEQYADWLVHDDVLDQAYQAAINRSYGAWGQSQYEILLSRQMTVSRASGAASGAAWEVRAKGLRADRRLQRQARRARRRGAQPDVAEPNDAQAAAVEESRQQCALLRDMFATLFRSVVIAPTWRARDVIDLARAAYNERLLPSGHLDPVRLAVLADALEEAGCSEQAILDHLRGPAPHVRGCWPVDLILAKE